MVSRKHDRGFEMILQHVTLNTLRLEKSIQFYKDVFGFVETDRPDFPLAGAWLWIEPRKTMLHLQNRMPDRAEELIDVNPVDHIALDARREGEDTIEEYRRWRLFLLDNKLNLKWRHHTEFRSHDPEKALQIFVTDPLKDVRWELNFPAPNGNNSL